MKLSLEILKRFRYDLGYLNGSILYNRNLRHLFLNDFRVGFWDNLVASCKVKKLYYLYLQVYFK